MDIDIETDIFVSVGRLNIVAFSSKLLLVNLVLKLSSCNSQLLLSIFLQLLLIQLPI